MAKKFHRGNGRTNRRGNAFNYCLPRYRYFNAIKPVEITLQILTEGAINLESFYSDDDEQFRIDFYSEGTPDALLYCGFLIQDGASEPETDRKHVLTLKATDNLALLKNTPWNFTGSPFQGKFSIGYYVRACLQVTGLYSYNSIVTPALPLRMFGNLFENTTTDRTANPVNDPYEKTYLDAAMFLQSDGTYLNCYDILTQILTDLNACLLQAGGAWIVIRPNEYKYFAGLIPGTQYVYDGTSLTAAAITLNESALIAQSGGNIYPVAEDQNKSLQRALNSVVDTFTFNNPASYIIKADLHLPPNATPFDHRTAARVLIFTIIVFRFIFLNGCKGGLMPLF